MQFDKAEQILEKADADALRRVLVITALPLEMKAVLAHLAALGSCPGRDGNIFELGRFSGTSRDWLVVVGESGAGNHQSQGMVSTAINDFGEFDLIVFVGVAATRKKQDAPIGSVVAGNHVYLASVGKYEKGAFLARSREFQVDPRLQGLARKIARDEHWHERLKPPYGGIMPTDANYPQPFPPTAVVASIVSVEAVSADLHSVLEQQITQTYQDATALEMEGYGAAYAAYLERVPNIIIRGISDAREGKDPELDKIHQPIAAAHSAAFAFELIDLWGSNYPSEHRPAISSPLPATAPALQQLTPVAQPPSETPAEAPAKSATANHTTLVLNFNGAAEDFPPETRDKIVDFIRTVTGNPSIQYAGEEVGSYHLFLKASEADKAKIESPEVSRDLSEKFGVDLVGVMTEAEYRSAPAFQSKIADASHALLDWPQTLPDGTSIERPELQKLLSLIDDTEFSTTALLGAPGSGKTALLAAFAHSLRTRDIPFLAIKADVLDTQVANEHDLQQFLSLPELPSQILRKLSQVGPVVLIIDQLDALAGYVDLRTGRLSSLLNLVRSVGGQQGIHVVLSARAFEFEHDTRLKSVRAESLSLELPPWSSILKILTANNIPAAGWPGDAQEVMRSPQALAILLKLAPNKTEPFTTYQAALEELWSQRVLAQPYGSQLAIVVGTIAEDMAEMETLWLASARYDKFAAELKILLAEGILTHPGNPGSIGFSHQTVFEFALARAFAQKEGRLSSYVLEREDSLFVRPKLWAALNYLRSVEQATYIAELKAIWSKTDLRLHLRHLLIEFLGHQKNPVEAEALIFEQALASNDRRAALQSMIGSAGWFSRLKWTVVSDAMADEKEVGVAASILSRATVFASTDVLDLIKTRWLPNKDYDHYAWGVLQETRNWTQAHLDAATTVIQRSPVSPYAFDYVISTIGAEQPEIALKLVLARLKQSLAIAKVEARKREAARAAEPNAEVGLFTSPYEPITAIVEASDGWDCLEALAKAVPEVLLSLLWPWFQEVLALLRSLENEDNDRGFPVRYRLDYRFEDEVDTLQLGEHPILGALRTAVETFAERDSDRFLVWFNGVQDEEAEPAQRLFAHALAFQPERFATRALEFLTGETRRFHLGNIEDLSATTKRLIERVNSHWTDKELFSFVSAVNTYSPKPADWRDVKSRQYFYRDTARLKLELLEALGQDRLSQETRSHILEERRRFGDVKRGTTFAGPTWVGSSMSADEIARADDDDVINAFRTLPDATGWDNPKTWQKGGNIQLSRSFADFAKSNHDRAVEIIKRFDADIGARAAGYALEAMAETATPHLITDLIRDLESRGFSGEEFRGSTARAIERLIDRDVEIDDGILEITIGWLSQPTVAPDTSELKADFDSDEELQAGALPQPGEKEEDKKREGSILWGMGGISILPHGNFPILEVIIRILLGRKDYTRLITLLEEHLDRPEEEKVWTSLLRLFPYIRPDDYAPLEHFFSRLFNRYPGTATSHEAAIFLAHAYWTVSNFVCGVLLLWRNHASPFVQQAFGELATLIWLVKPDLEWAEPMAEGILKGGPSPARTGAAHAAVHIWAETDEKDRTSALLERLIKTSDDETWAAIVDLFRIVDEVTPTPEWIAVLQAIAEQIPLKASFNSTFVVERLQSLLPHHASLVAKISIALVSKWSGELGDMRTGTAAVAPELVDIAITLHRLGPQTRQLGLELFEKLLTVNAYTARETLNQIDNRFRENAPTARPRLPRRTRRPAGRVRRAARA